MRYNPIALYAGIFSGVGAALWTLFEYAMGWHNERLETGAVTGFVAILFPVAAIVWALQATKRSSGDHLRMTQALMTGLAVSTISAAIGILFFYAYYTAINPAFVEAMAARGHPVNIMNQLIAVAAGSFVLGLLTSAVVGYLMRTKGS